VRPAALTGTPPGSIAGEAEVRFRPSGRVFGTDLDLNNDDALLEVFHPQLIGDTKKILVEGNGLLCLLARGNDPPGTYPTFSCPRS
jgi:hypothetical protein